MMRTRNGRNDGFVLAAPPTQLSTPRSCAILLLSTILLAMLTSSCHKKPASAAIPNPVPSTPLKATPLTDYEMAEESFDSGDYDAATRFYEASLKTGTPRDFQDRALFRLGLLYGFKGQGTQDLARSQAQFQRLLQQFPKSRFRVEASVLSSLQNEVIRLNNSLEDQQVETEKLKGDLKDREGEVTKLKAGRRDQLQEIDRYKSDLKEQQAKIKALTEELERLKAIDLQRRPSHPPK